MKSRQELESLTVDELLAYKNTLSSAKAALISGVDQLEQDIKSATKSNEQKEFDLNCDYKERISELRTQNKAAAHELQIEENIVVNDLYKKLRDVLREKEELEERLKHEEDVVIEKLMSEIEKVKGTELALEAQLTDVLVPVDTESISSELDQLYQDSINKKNEFSLEYIQLRLEVERLITSNSLLSQRIASAQMEITLRQTGSKEGIIPSLSPVSPQSRRFSMMPAPPIPHKRKRRITTKT